jgi:hypothetical protein
MTFEILSALKSDKPIYSALLPGLTAEKIKALPDYLRRFSFFDLRSGIIEGRLIRQLQEAVVPEAASASDASKRLTVGAQPAPSATKLRAIQFLATALRTENATFFVGSSAVRLPITDLSACAAVSEKLADELSMPPGFWPLSVSSELFQAARQVDLARDWSSRVDPLYEGQPELFSELAELIRALQYRQFGRIPPATQLLIVSTNIDLLIERAFLTAGVPFTRVWCNSFPTPCKEVRNGLSSTNSRGSS